MVSPEPRPGIRELGMVSPEPRWCPRNPGTRMVSPEPLVSPEPRLELRMVSPEPEVLSPEPYGVPGTPALSEALA